MSREFVQLDDNLFVIPHCVAAVKRAGEDSCVVYVKAADDGFVVKSKAEDVVEDLEEAMKSDEEGE